MKPMRLLYAGLAIVLLLGVLSTCVGIQSPLNVPVIWGFHLLTGWTRYLSSTLPRVSVRWGAAASLAVYLVVFVTGAHLFLKWLYRESTEGRAWRVRWTLCGTAIVLLLFVAGIAAVGVTHQAAWLATSPVRLHTRERPINRVKCSNNLRQIALACIMYASARDGRFPDDLQTVLATEEITSDVFICPSDDEKERAPHTQPALPREEFHRKHCSYVYVGRGVTTAAGAETPVAYEPLSNHDGHGINVVFADAHVDWLDREAAVKFLRGFGAERKLPTTQPEASGR